MKADDPVSRGAEGAIAHLNADHDEALLEMVQALGCHPEASAARCVDVDRTGLDLIATTAAGEVPVRVEYAKPIEAPEGLHKATVKLAQRARAELPAARPGPNDRRLAARHGAFGRTGELR